MQHVIFLAVSVPTYSCLCCFEQENAESADKSHALEMDAKELAHTKELAHAEELAVASKKHKNKIASTAKQHNNKQAAALKQHKRDMVSKNRQHRKEQAADSELHDKEVAVLTKELKITNEVLEHNRKEALHFQEEARRLK